MATVLFVAIVIVLLAAAAALVLFVRWLSRSWTVVAEDDAQAKEGDGFWARLRTLFGRGPPRLTYRRDQRGRFRKYRR